MLNYLKISSNLVIFCLFFVAKTAIFTNDPHSRTQKILATPLTFKTVTNLLTFRMNEHHCKNCKKLVTVFSLFETFDQGKYVTIKGLPIIIEKLDTIIKLM